MNVFCRWEDKTGERRYVSSLQGQVIETVLIEHWQSNKKLKSSTFPLELQAVFHTLSWAKESFNYSRGRVMEADKVMEGKKVPSYFLASRGYNSYHSVNYKFPFLQRHLE